MSSDDAALNERSQAKLFESLDRMLYKVALTLNLVALEVNMMKRSAMQLILLFQSLIIVR